MKRPGAKRCSPQVPSEDRCSKMIHDYRTGELKRCTRRAVGREQMTERFCKTHDPRGADQKAAARRSRFTARHAAWMKLQDAVAVTRKASAKALSAAVEHVAAEYELAKALGVPHASTPLSNAVDDYVIAKEVERNARGGYEIARDIVRNQGRGTVPKPETWK